MDRTDFARRIKAGTNPRSSNALGRQRHGQVLDLARQGPVWADALVTMGLCGSRRVANRLLARLERKKKLRLLGRELIGETGGLTLVFGNYNVGYHQLEHDVMAMQIVLAYWPCAFRVGRECDPETRFDAEVELDDPFGIEADNDTEGAPMLRKRLEIIARSDRTCLFVARRVERLRMVMRLAGGMGNIFFAPLSAVLSDPWGLIWADPSGKAARVEGPVAGGGAGAGAPARAGEPPRR